MRNFKSKGKIQLYGLWWEPDTPPIIIEMEMCRHGGQWKNSRGDTVGNGLPFHFRKFQEILWGENKIWHKWNILQMECFLKYRIIGVMGPASSGKSCSAGTDVLADWFIWPECTTVLCRSTTREMLENRIWGEIKKYFKLAKEKHDDFIPGHLIEGRQRILLDSRKESVEGRDFRCGLQGIPVKRGENFVGLGDFAGIKNKRVRLIGDELSLLPRIFFDAFSNLDKNPDFKGIGLGNPKETTDALGVMCEPAPSLGGWESGIDQKPGTKIWETKRADGICIQLPGDDSPNLDGKLGIPLITQKDIDKDISFYGKDSLWYTMMDLGRMPKGQGSRRVLTKQMCLRNNAMDEPIWLNSNRKKIAALDAAYRGVGGDRCVLMFFEFGDESTPFNPSLIVSNLITQNPNQNKHNKLFALTETIIVPVNVSIKEEPEDQIAKFVKEQCEAQGVPPEDFFFDAGMRTSLVSAFARIWSVDVNSVDCMGRPSEQSVSAEIQTPCCDYYSKFVTELWYSVRFAVESKQVRGMTDEVIMEFSSREWTMVSGNRIEVEPKDKMKQKFGRSPDLADAFAIGLFGARKRGFTISKLSAQSPKSKGGKDWRTEINKKADALKKSGSLSYST